MVMGERIKRTTRHAAGKVQDAGAAHPDDVGREADGTAGPNPAETPHSGDARPASRDVRRP